MIRLVAILALLALCLCPAQAETIANPVATFTGLDKITGRITPFDVYIGETVQFGALQITPRACYTRPTTEVQRTSAFLEVDQVSLQGTIRRIFTGWMFADSPALNAVDHPVYDIWLTDCKMSTDVPPPDLRGTVEPDSVTDALVPEEATEGDEPAETPTQQPVVEAPSEEPVVEAPAEEPVVEEDPTPSIIEIAPPGQ